MKKVILFTLLVFALQGCNDTLEDANKETLTLEKGYKMNNSNLTLGNSYRGSFANNDPYPHCENIPTFSEPLNQGEKLFYGSYFPNLNIDKARVTSISTKCYNCVAWTLGITDAWIWPDGGHLLPSPEATRLEFFDEFYQNLGYVKTTNPNEAEIEAWGIQPPKGQLYMTHASVIYAGSQTTWESKFGGLERLTHGMNELVSDTYGNAVVYYKKSANMVNIEQLRKQYVMPRIALNGSQYRKFNNKIVSVGIKTIIEFDEKFEKWKRTWNQDSIKLSSNPADRMRSTEYQELYQMGDVILPLVVQQLFLYPEDFFALQLYDNLQKDNNLKVIYKGPRDLQILEGEQSRANRTTKLYIESL